MSGKTEISQQPRRKGWKHQVIVHLLKVTRLPTDLSSPSIDITPHHTVRRNTRKVTVLYDSLQIPLGDFPMLMNECVINQRLACQFCVSKPETQAKLYLYIDQAYSSGLTGHLALDLHEFVREDDSEVYVKYPLYANTSNQCRGPAVKILIRYLGVKRVKPFADEENDIFLLPHQRIEELQKSRVCSTEDDAISLHDSCSSLNGGTQPCNPDEVDLSHLETTLSEIGEKLKSLVSSFKSKEFFPNGDYPFRDIECQSSTTSPLLSSFHTGTSVDSRSEICEEQCTDSDDVFDSSVDSGNLGYPPSIPRISRTLSGFSYNTSNLRFSQADRQGMGISNDVDSEPWSSHSSTQRKSLSHQDHCSEECFICSLQVLDSYEGIQASLSRSRSAFPGPTSKLSNVSQASTAKMYIPAESQPSKSGEKEHVPSARKGPSLLKGLFSAVIVAGVSFLGVRNSSGGRSQSNDRKVRSVKSSQDSFSASDIRHESSSRCRYSFRY